MNEMRSGRRQDCQVKRPGKGEGAGRVPEPDLEETRAAAEPVKPRQDQSEDGHRVAGPETPPPPKFRVRPAIYHGGLDDALLPRPYLFTDGDHTNAIVNVGVRLGTEHGDPLVNVGLDLVIPPRLFWLLDPLLRIVGR